MKNLRLFLLTYNMLLEEVGNNNSEVYDFNEVVL